jgi:hypothetical protein
MGLYKGFIVVARAESRKGVVASSWYRMKLSIDLNGYVCRSRIACSTSCFERDLLLHIDIGVVRVQRIVAGNRNE